LDILGFKRLIMRTVSEVGDNSAEIESLIETLNLIKTHLKDDDTGVPNYSRQITHFSDSIIISFKEDQEGEVFKTLFKIQQLIIILVNRGILCRGAISYGKLLHNSDYIFGPALVKAYELESKAAQYPRVILDKSIIEIGIRFHCFANTQIEEQLDIGNLLLKDSDDMYFIDYFVNPELAFPNFHEDMGTYIKNLKSLIISGLELGEKDASIKIKYGWMKNKFNSLVHKWQEPLGQIFLKGNPSLLKNISELEYIRE
jgi:hypothetical protein